MKIDSVRPVTIILVGEDQAAKYIFAKKLSERTGFSIVDLNTRKADDYYPIDDVSDDEIDECRAYNRYQYVDDVLSSDMISTSYIYYISDNMVDSYNYEKFVDLLNGFDLVLNLRAPKSVSPKKRVPGRPGDVYDRITGKSVILDVYNKDGTVNLHEMRKLVTEVLHACDHSDHHSVWVLEPEREISD